MAPGFFFSVGNGSMGIPWTRTSLCHFLNCPAEVIQVSCLSLEQRFSNSILKGLKPISRQGKGLKQLVISKPLVITLPTSYNQRIWHCLPTTVAFEPKHL